MAQCPKSYEYHYIHKIRPNKLHSALLFGSSFDKASDVIFQPQNHPNKTAEEVFYDSWEFQDIDGVRTYIPTNTKLIYAQTDFDKDLVQPADLKQLNLTKDELLELVARRKEVGFFNLNEQDQATINHAFWLNLAKKGFFFIDALRTQIMPRVTRVLSTQEYIEINNGSDSIVGYIDAVLEIEGYEYPIVVDIKTSSRNYLSNSVATSQQLSLYVEAVTEKYNTKTAAYVVFNKNLIKNKIKTCTACGHNGTGRSHKTCDNEINGKRCNGVWDEIISPSVFTQFIISAIPERTTEIVMENFDAVNTLINNGVYIRNLGACDNIFGKPCDYYALCHENKMDGLTKKEG